MWLNGGKLSARSHGRMKLTHFPPSKGGVVPLRQLQPWLLPFHHVLQFCHVSLLSSSWLAFRDNLVTSLLVPAIPRVKYRLCEHFYAHSCTSHLLSQLFHHYCVPMNHSKTIVILFSLSNNSKRFNRYNVTVDISVESSRCRNNMFETWRWRALLFRDLNGCKIVDCSCVKLRDSILLVIFVLITILSNIVFGI